MDKIFKNNTIMGIVAVVTLILVGLMYLKNTKASTSPSDNSGDPSTTTQVQ